jgi:glycerol uptake facilitator-like aquaporin
MLKGGKTNPSNDGALQALTVALTLGGLIQVANHHAASFNPAVTLGLTLFQTQALENTNGYLSHYFYAYFVGPWIGGLLAGLFARVHRPLHEPDSKSLAS